MQNCRAVEKQLDNLMSKVKNTQMHKYEYLYISKFLGNKNFLVFGTGHDSPFWRECNYNGNTVFLEHDLAWILPTSKDVYNINYTCSITDYLQLLTEFRSNNFENLEISLPDIVLKTNWDCILVDGPPGNKKKSHGRMQSIYTAYKLANKNTHIFVHDCDREVEDTFTKEMFNIIFCDLIKLRHCMKNYEI